MASAAGTVRTRVESDGDKVVRVVHNSEWSSEVHHLSQINVANGQHVEQGDQIGRVGRTSTQYAHLHYMQLSGEIPRRIYFNGAPLNPDYYFRPPGSTWNGPSYTSQNCPVRSFAGVSVAARSSEVVNVFAVGSDGILRHRPRVSGTWHACWVSIPGGTSARLKGDPAAISVNPGRLDVFAVATDNRLLHITWTSGHGWYNWRDTGSVVNSSPAVTSRGSGYIDVFAVNADKRVIYRNYNTAAEAWTTNWSAIGDNAATTLVSSGPAAVASLDGNSMNIFARGANGRLHSLMWTRSNGWYNWVDGGQPHTGRATAVTRGGGDVDVFLRDSDNSFIHWHVPNGSNWNPDYRLDFGGNLFASPTAITPSSTRIDVFARNNEAAMISRIWQAGHDWTNWAGHGPIGGCP